MVCLSWLRKAELWEKWLLLLSVHCRGRGVVWIVAPSAHSVIEFAI